jgi:hypothetical protein
MAEIKAHNAEAGFFFFSRDTMRFFDSGVLPYVYEGPGGVAFVTSEKSGFGQGFPRRYTARRYSSATGDVRTIGPGGKLDMADARQVAKWFAAGKITAQTTEDEILLLLGLTAGPLPGYLKKITDEEATSEDPAC